MLIYFYLHFHIISHATMKSKAAPWKIKAVEVKGSVRFNKKTKQNSYIFSPCYNNAMEMNVILFVVLEASRKLYRAS